MAITDAAFSAVRFCNCNYIDYTVLSYSTQYDRPS